MKIEVNKRIFLGILISALVVAGVIGVYAYNSNLSPSVMGHSAGEIDWSQKIAGNISANGFCIGTDCITAWPSGGGGGGGGSSQWTTLGNNIYYNAGNVGIGVATPTQKLDVAGSINVTDSVNSTRLCVGSNCISDIKAVPVYSINRYCSGAGEITFFSTCTTRMTCQYYTSSGYKNAYFDCKGFCNMYSTSPKTCSNDLKGYLVS